MIYVHRAEVAISFESLWLLAQEHMSKTALLHELPPEVLRYLTQALVLAGSAEDDTAVRKKYLDQVKSEGSLIGCCLVAISRVPRRDSQSGKLCSKNPC